jgi:HAD superfamily hydrolase (TIGR01509 family)
VVSERRATTVGGVLWDLDGTLVDSAGYHWLAWRDTLAAEGRLVTPEDFANTFGKRNDEILHELFGNEIAPDWIEHVSRTKEQAYRRIVRERGIEALPGAINWLARLRRRGWRQALASSAPRPNIDVVFDALGLRGHLDAVVSADEVGSGKPDPAIFLAGALRLRLPPERCIVVEDAPAGIEAARRAGMRSIGVLSPHHAHLSGDLVVSSLEALVEDAFERLLAAD